MNPRCLAKIIGVACIMFFALPHLVIASQDNGAITEVKYTAEFSETDLSFGKFDVYDLIHMKNASVFSVLEKPVLPEVNIKLAIPAGTEVIEVQARSLNSLDIPGEFYVMPGQPPLKTSEKTSETSSQLSVEPDYDVYGSNSLYPDKLAKFANQGDLAGQEIVDITIYPVQYVPKDRKLIFNKSVELIVKCRPVTVHKKEFAEQYYRFTENQRKIYDEMIKKMVVNPEDVVLNPRLGEKSPMLATGHWDHIIITSNNFASYFQPLIDWHMKRGLRDTVITTEWIYANYTGPGDTTKIRQFIINASTHWGTIYFLMGGEDFIVPFAYRKFYYYDENTPSDQYYSDFDDDWIHEVFVGRVSIESADEVSTFVNKVLKYEKNPPLTDYPLDILLIGMDAGGLTPGTHWEDLKEMIDEYIPERFNVTKVYDSDPDDHEEAAKAALNAGQNLVNHADHCDWYIIGTGDLNHGSGIDKGEVDDLYNDNKPSIVVSLGCYPNRMDDRSTKDDQDCIAEHFVLYNPNQAGVAFTGNTRAGWFIFGEPASLSGELDKLWWQGVFDEEYPMTNLGMALNWSKHQFSTDGDEQDKRKHCEWTFNLLGEPAMPIWTDTPTFFVVTHPPELPIGSSSFTVHVDSFGGGDVENAYVCLWKGSDVYSTGYTNSSGDLGFNLDPTTQGDMYVTVTKHNYIPYEGSATVEPDWYVLDVNDFPMYQAHYHSDYGYEAMTGPAVAQMTLNYMWWDSDEDPTPPLIFDSQEDLYTEGIEYNSDPSLEYFDLHGMWGIIQYNKPEPYSQYGYNFTKRHDEDRDKMLKLTCQWIDYTIGTYGGYEPGHPLHVPAIIPVYGDYTNWMAVRGIHTDVEAYPMPDELTIYGFWINDPLPGGIGANCYRTVHALTKAYYKAMTVGDYIGEYLGIFEPPESVEGCELTLASPISRFTEQQINAISAMPDQDVIAGDLRTWIIQAAINGVTEELIPYDENFKEVFEKTHPDKPFFVTSISGDDYYAVPFIPDKPTLNPKAKITSEIDVDVVTKIKSNSDIRSTARTKSIPDVRNQAKDEVMVLEDLILAESRQRIAVVILINAQDGSFKEASWIDTPVEYLPILKEQAQQIAFDTAEEMGLAIYDIDDLKPKLIHRESTPYYPQWRVIIGEYAIYISQDGTVSIEDWGQGDQAGGGIMADEGSLVYALNTAVPTPFVRNTTISYSIAKPGNVSLNIYDVTGRLVKTLVNQKMDAGAYTLTWRGYDNNNQKLAHGVYFTRLKSGDFVSVKKVILVK